jgi:hypothetical protein
MQGTFQDPIIILFVITHEKHQVSREYLKISRYPKLENIRPAFGGRWKVLVDKYGIGGDARQILYRFCEGWNFHRRSRNKEKVWCLFDIVVNADPNFD